MRLVSYNIHKCFGGLDRRYRPARIVEVLRALDADLICIQEADFNVKRSDFDDQPAFLREELAYPHAVFQLNHPHRDGGYGNLVLSKHPFNSTHMVNLRIGKRKLRGALVVVADTPEGPVRVVNWHLGLAEVERRAQAALLLAHETLSPADDVPTLLTGDFNDWRDCLGGCHLHAGCFRHATSPAKKFRSFPAYFPLAALDKLYVRGDVVIDDLRVEKSPLARRASDHLPLVADFRVARAGGTA